MRDSDRKVGCVEDRLRATKRGGLDGCGRKVHGGGSEGRVGEGRGVLPRGIDDLRCRGLGVDHYDGWVREHDARIRGDVVLRGRVVLCQALSTLALRHAGTCTQWMRQVDGSGSL